MTCAIVCARFMWQSNFDKFQWKCSIVTGFSFHAWIVTNGKYTWSKSRNDLVWHFREAMSNVVKHAWRNSLVLPSFSKSLKRLWLFCHFQKWHFNVAQTLPSPISYKNSDKGNNSFWLNVASHVKGFHQECIISEKRLPPYFITPNHFPICTTCFIIFCFLCNCCATQLVTILEKSS